MFEEAKKYLIEYKIYEYERCLSTIAKNLALSNRIDEAQKMFEEAITTALDVTHNQHRSIALCDISSHLAESKLFDLSEYVAEMIEYKYYKAKALSTIAKNLALSNRIDEAQKMFEDLVYLSEKIGDRYLKAEIIGEIIANSLKFAILLENVFDHLDVDLEIHYIHIITNMLEAKKKYWDHVIEHCIGLNNIVNYIVILIGIRNPPLYNKIKLLMLKYSH